MSFDRIRTLLVLACTAMLAACNTANSHIGDEDPGFGESVKYDQAIQTVNPNPVYAPGGALPGDNGTKGQTAVKRYRTDAVKAVEASQTSAGATMSTGTH